MNCRPGTAGVGTEFQCAFRGEWPLQRGKPQAPPFCMTFHINHRTVYEKDCKEVIRLLFLFLCDNHLTLEVEHSMLVPTV